MGRESKKPPEAEKGINVILDGKLHLRLKAMARAHRRSLKQEILACIEKCLEDWQK